MPNFKALSIFQIWETYQLYFSHPIYYLAIYVYKCHFSEKGYTPGYPRFPYAMSGDKISFALSPKLICKRKITFRKYLIKEMVRWNKSPKLLSWIQILQLKGSCEIQKASLYPPIFLSVLFHIYNRHNIFFFEESNQNLNQAQKAITGKYTRYKLSKKILQFTQVNKSRQWLVIWGEQNLIFIQQLFSDGKMLIILKAYPKSPRRKSGENAHFCRQT